MILRLCFYNEGIVFQAIMFALYTFVLYWVEDNLGYYDEFLNEQMQNWSLDLLICSPACYHYATPTRENNYIKNKRYNNDLTNR